MLSRGFELLLYDQRSIPCFLHFFPYMSVTSITITCLFIQLKTHRTDICTEILRLVCYSAFIGHQYIFRSYLELVLGGDLQECVLNHVTTRRCWMRSSMPHLFEDFRSINVAYAPDLS